MGEHDLAAPWGEGDPVLPVVIADVDTVADFDESVAGLPQVGRGDDFVRHRLVMLVLRSGTGRDHAAPSRTAENCKTYPAVAAPKTLRPAPEVCCTINSM